MRMDPNGATDDSIRCMVSWRRVWIVAAAALIMGLPTLRGTFVDGDDRQLALDHALVNHPSFSHAIELFKIVHRDLYQPIPLLTFSAEFAMAQFFGLFDRSIEGGAWIFHLTNVLLHAANSVLVLLVITQLQNLLDRRVDVHIAHILPTPNSVSRTTPIDPANAAPWVGTATAVFFALHPLNAEVVAWINGRMMALSTLFALSSVLAFSVWLRHGRWRWLFITILCVALCMMSKVRVGVPALFLILGFVGRDFRSARFWSLWFIALIVTAVFVLVNLDATSESGSFESGGRHLQGPRIVRVLMALAWYFQHVVIPTGLAAWYPTPSNVSLANLVLPEVFFPLFCATAFFAWACPRSLAATLGFVWFFATIVDTLPIVPARNLLAADRYMHLSIIGLFWLISSLVRPKFSTATTLSPFAWRRRIARVIVGMLLISMTGLSWYAGSFYLNGIRKRTRIATLFPTTSEVWVRVASTHYLAGMTARKNGEFEQSEFQFQKACECANRERANESSSGHAEALTVLGLSHLKLGRPDEGLLFLQEAVAIDPDNAEPKSCLGFALEEFGRLEEALPYYEAAATMLPLHNPTLIKLAKAYHKLGRPDEARVLYDRALAINAFEIIATCGLAELDIERATPDGFQTAEKRLRKLLDWMPENIEARTALGVALNGQGRVAEALSEYQHILALQPGEVTAALNLAQILFAQGNVLASRPYFVRVAQHGAESFEQAIAVHDFFVHAHEPRMAVESWKTFGVRSPQSEMGLAMYAWSQALAGDAAEADRLLQLLSEEDRKLPLVTAASCYVSLVSKRYENAVESVNRLIDAGNDAHRERQRLLRSLEWHDEQNPGVTWTYCLTADLLSAESQTDAAAAFLKLCDDLCADDPCREYAQWIRTNRTAIPGKNGTARP
ncbi:MAG: tetratricopeptide repeat protein [Planctomycetota bacterium]